MSITWLNRCNKARRNRGGVSSGGGVKINGWVSEATGYRRRDFEIKIRGKSEVMGLCRCVTTITTTNPAFILQPGFTTQWDDHRGLMARRGFTIGRFIICLVFFFYLSVRRVPYPIGCGTSALWRMHLSHAREAMAAIMEHNVTQPTYSKAEAFRCHGGTNGNRDQDGGGCVCASVCVCGCELSAWHRAALRCQVVIFLRAAHNGLLSLLRQHCNSSAPWRCVKAVAASASEGRISTEKKYVYQRFQI